MELSEAFYAGLSFVPDTSLQEAQRDQEAFMELYNVAVQNFAGPGVKDSLGSDTKSKALRDISVPEGQEPKKKFLNDLASMISAVVGTRKKFGGIPDAVYLTGNKWHPDVEKFRIDDFGMKDYNSSDVILNYGNRFVGISLKKKPTITSDSPTMINNSFQTFLNQKDLKPLEEKINDVRIRFYANVIQQACQPGGPLADLTNGMSADDILKLNPAKKSDAQKIFNLKVKRLKGDGKKSPYIPLINLKGTDEIDRGGNTSLPPKTREDFRKFVNQSLYSSPGRVNPLFQAFLDVMNDPKISSTIADSLLNKTLKLKLFDSLDTWSDFEYDFLLVEGVGQVNTKLEPNIAAANVSSLHSMMIAVLMLRKLPASLEFDKEKTGTGAARVNFVLRKGKYKILDIVLRYKGAFSSMPQFLATTTQEFKDLTKRGDKFLMDLRG